MFSLKPYLYGKCKSVDAALDGWLPGDKGRLFEAMRYSVTAGGKRLRPILCIAAAEALGAVEADVMPAACAIEMLHTYSLIHDDLPAMDDDDLRRGKATAHIRFDEATAILAGDALLTLAFQVLSAAEMHKRFGGRRICRIIHKLATAAGPAGMIDGQMQDIASEGSALSLEALQCMHGLKTGALIEAAVVCGAVLAGADETKIERLSRFAIHVGLAFQVWDDLLNVTGDTALTGKRSGTDAARGKNTFPDLMGIRGSEAFARRLVQKALQALNGFDNRADALRAIAQYIVERNR